MWTYVWSKIHAIWLWFAVCRRTQQVVWWVVGARDEKSCRALKESIEEEYRGCKTRSDGLVVYAKVFGEKHELCGKESGETTKVEGTNNKLRQRLGYLIRKTLSATKTLGVWSCFFISFLLSSTAASQNATSVINTTMLRFIEFCETIKYTLGAMNVRVLVPIKQKPDP
jgi:insertion element IS1 protein InsB